MSSSAAGWSLIQVRTAKIHSWTRVNKKQSISSLHRSSLRVVADLLSSEWNHIMPLSKAHTSLCSPLSPLSLSLSGDSLTIPWRCSSPDLYGSFPGAPSNWPAQASTGWERNDSAQIGKSLTLFFLPTSFKDSLHYQSTQPVRSPECFCLKIKNHVAVRRDCVFLLPTLKHTAGSYPEKVGGEIRCGFNPS